MKATATLAVRQKAYYRPDNSFSPAILKINSESVASKVAGQSPPSETNVLATSSARRQKVISTPEIPQGGPSHLRKKNL
jgi:hypothetical protein